MCEQGILDRGVSEGCDFRRPNTYEESTPPPDRVHLPRTECTSPGQGTPPPDRVRLQVMWCSTTTVRNEFPDTSEEGAPPGKILTMLSHVIANKSVVV